MSPTSGRSFLFRLIRFAIIVYLLGAAGLYFLQDYLIYPGKWMATSEYREQKYDKWKDYERFFEPEEGVRIQSWHIEKTGAPLLVFFGPNAQDNVDNLFMFDHLEAYSILMFNYRGFGKSTGSPGEALNVSDALLILNQIMKETNRKPEDVILAGCSLGSGVAVQVAAARGARKLVLTVPFDSLLSVAGRKMPWFPVSLLLKDKYLSTEYAPKVTCPVYIFAALEDEVVPVECARNLAEKFPNCEYKEYPGVGHNNLFDAQGSYDDFLWALKK